METLLAILLVFAISSSGGVIQAAENLPNVLILGDQIYQQSAADLKKELKGKAEIHYPRDERTVVWNTTTALELLDRYLGYGKWISFHLNCGLGDLIHRAPGMKVFCVMPHHAGGRRVMSPEQYKISTNSQPALRPLA